MAGMDLPYWRCWAAETLSDSRFQSWDVAERGAFWTLLNIQWREGFIPGDLTSLAKLLHVDSSAMRSLWSAIGDRFIPHPDHSGGLANPRMEEEREEAIASINQKKKAGKLGAESRWSKAKRAHAAAIAVPSAGDAVPLAHDSDQGNVTQSKIPHRQSRLVSPFPSGADPYPATTAVLAALYGRGIVDAFPPSARSAAMVEAVIGSVGVDVAAERLAPILADPSAKRPLTYHVDAIRGPSRPARGIDDSAIPWNQRLSPDEHAEAQAELAALALQDPELEGAPLGIVGNPSSPAYAALQAVNAKWRAVAAARAEGVT